jgi:hypothetical protein
MLLDHWADRRACKDGISGQVDKGIMQRRKGVENIPKLATNKWTFPSLAQTMENFRRELHRFLVPALKIY